MKQFAGDHSIQLPPAPMFPCQEQGCMQDEAASPYFQCLTQWPAASLTSLEASGSSTAEAGLPPPRPLCPRPKAPLPRPRLRPRSPWAGALPPCRRPRNLAALPLQFPDGHHAAPTARPPAGLGPSGLCDRLKQAGPGFPSEAAARRGRQKGLSSPLP